MEKETQSLVTQLWLVQCRGGAKYIVSARSGTEAERIVNWETLDLKLVESADPYGTVVRASGVERV